MAARDHDMSESDISDVSSGIPSSEESDGIDNSDFSSDSLMSTSSDDALQPAAAPHHPPGIRPPAARGRVRGGRVRMRGGRGVARGRGRATPPAAYRQGWNDGRRFVPPNIGFTGIPGNNADYSNLSIVGIFQLFFTNAVWDLIVNETNRYAAQVMATWPANKPRKWVDVDAATMQAFVALILTMGVISLPRYHMYWSISRILRQPFFSSVMSRNMFLRILRFFHLADNTAVRPNDKLGKVRPFLDYIIPTFRTVYTPSENLSPDESMIAFKGRLGFVQYMPMKPTKWGIKCFALCESNTGYTVNMKVYTGREEDLQQPNVNNQGHDPATSHPGQQYLYASGKVVLDLLEGLEHQGYKVYCDNFYTSPALFHRLQVLGFGACGTVKFRSTGLPDAANPRTNQLRRGADAQYHTKSDQLVIVWHDKKQVTLLTTIHRSGESEKRMRCRHEPTGFRTIRKPNAVSEYNQHMGGVDLADQFFQYYSHAHRTSKWWKRIFFHLIEVCMVNARIVYKAAHPAIKIDSLKFRLALISGLLDGWQCQRKVGRPRGRQGLPARPARLTKQEHNPGKNADNAKPDCVVCSNRIAGQRKQTVYCCKKCELPMCPVPCFELFHTQENYRR